MNLKIYSLGYGKKGANIMGLEWNNVKPACCAKWLVLPTVYSDALSYGEQLDKFCYQLNKVIENNNILPDFITEMIKEYISSGAIGDVVSDILGDYILNVKYPPNGITPAVGDGSSDDTKAIQYCIDYAAKNGGVVYFPYGSYLTQSLTMKDGVSLFGFDRYSTKIVLKGGATKPLIGGTVANFSISNLTLDGNSGVQVNDVNVVTILATNVLLTNLVIKDGYTLVNYIGTGGHFQISDVVFGNSVEKCLLTTGNAAVQCDNVEFTQLSAVGGISVMDIGTDGGFFNVKSIALCDKCIVISGNNNKISAIVENATIPVVDNGLQNNIEIFGAINKEFYSGNCSKHVKGALTTTVDGAVTKTIAGTATETYGDRNITSKNVNRTNDDVTNTCKKFTDNANEVTKNYTSEHKNIVNSEVLTCNELSVNTTSPIKYNHTPDVVNKFFKTLDISCDGTTEKILLKNEILPDITTVNVKDYGAVGDGVTDDTVAIQRAINENTPTDTTGLFHGCSILFPNGVYVISNTIELPAFINLIGEGRGQTMLYLTNAVNKPLIKTRGYDNFVVDKHSRWYITNKVPQLCGVKNMILFGNKWNNTYDALVQLYGCNITFENVYFYGYSGWAIYQEWGDGVNEEWVLNYDKMSENVFTDCSFFEGDKGIFQSERVNDVSYYNIFMGRIDNIGAEIKGTSYFNYAHFYDCNRGGKSDYAVKFSAQGKFNLIIESMHVKPAALFNGYFQDINAEFYLNENIDVQLGVTNSKADIKVNGSNEKETTVYIPNGTNNIYNVVQGGSYGRIFVEGISNSILNITSNKDVHLAQGAAFTNVTGNAIGSTVNTGSGVDNVWYPGKE